MVREAVDDYLSNMSQGLAHATFSIFSGGIPFTNGAITCNGSTVVHLDTTDLNVVLITWKDLGEPVPSGRFELNDLGLSFLPSDGDVLWIKAGKVKNRTLPVDEDWGVERGVRMGFALQCKKNSTCMNRRRPPMVLKAAKPAVESAVSECSAAKADIDSISEKLNQLERAIDRSFNTCADHKPPFCNAKARINFANKLGCQELTDLLKNRPW